MSKEDGSIFLRNIIFILLMGIIVLVARFCEKNQVRDHESKWDVLKKVQQIKIRMIKMQVGRIVGDPLRSEQAPFLKDNLIIGETKPKNGQEVAKMLLPTSRDIFELKFTDADDFTRAYRLEVYYDARSEVCKIHYYLLPGVAWDLVEMYD